MSYPKEERHRKVLVNASLSLRRGRLFPFARILELRSNLLVVLFHALLYGLQGLLEIKDAHHPRGLR